MRWLSNHHPNFVVQMLIQDGDRIRVQTPEEAQRDLEEWLEGKIIAPPRPTEKVTVEQLIRDGYVGVYSPDE